MIENLAKNFLGSLESWNRRSECDKILGIDGILRLGEEFFRALNGIFPIRGVLHDLFDLREQIEEKIHILLGETALFFEFFVGFGFEGKVAIFFQDALNFVFRQFGLLR